MSFSPTEIRSTLDMVWLEVCRITDESVYPRDAKVCLAGDRLAAFTTELRPALDKALPEWAEAQEAQVLAMARAHLTKVTSEERTEHAGYAKALDAALKVLVPGSSVDEAKLISAVREAMAAPDVRKYRAARGPWEPLAYIAKGPAQTAEAWPAAWATWNGLALQYGGGLARNQQAAAVGEFVDRLQDEPVEILAVLGGRWEAWQKAQDGSSADQKKALTTDDWSQLAARALFKIGKGAAKRAPNRGGPGREVRAAAAYGEGKREGAGKGSGLSGHSPPQPSTSHGKTATGHAFPPGASSGPRLRCFQCGRPGHKRADCTAPPVASCTNCGGFWHSSDECGIKPPQNLYMVGHSASSRPRPSRQATPRSVVLRAVATSTHRRANRAARILAFRAAATMAVVQPEPATATAHGPGVRVAAAPIPRSGYSFELDGSINGVQVQVLGDTGAEVALISEATANATGVAVHTLRQTWRLNGVVAGASSKVTRTATVPVRIGGQTNTVQALVVPGLAYQMVLGVRELFCAGRPATWTCDGDGGVAIKFGDAPPVQARVRHAPLALDNTVLAVVRTTDSLLVAEWEVPELDESASTEATVAAAVRSLNVPCLTPGEPAVRQDPADDRADDRDAWRGVRINPTLPGKVQKDIRRCLDARWKAFTDRAVPPVMRGVVHHIALKADADLATARESVRRLPPERQAAVDKLLGQLEGAGRTVSMPSLAAAVPVVVKKKDDKGEFAGFRVAVDFRKLNQLSVVEAYPMPSADQIVHGVARYPLRSKWDAKSCYHAIPLDAQSVPLTGTWFGPGRQVCWKVAPFGLASIPQTLQRAMDQTFGPVPRTWPYMDDIVNGHESAEGIVADVVATLDAVRGRGMTLSPKKCWVGYESLPVLGFEVAHNSVRATSERAAMLRDWPQPETPRELRRFLGVAQVYVAHVPGFQEMAAELRPWVGRNPKMFADSWSYKQTQAFDELREALFNMVPQAPLTDGPVRLETDFSAKAMAWILSQRIDDVWRIVDAGSRVCNKWEAEYAPMDGEIAALAAALRKLDHLGLRGREIEWVTDNRPATDALFSGHRSKARIRRTAAFLTRYNITARYQAGSTLPADALTRLKEYAPADGMPEPEVYAEEVEYLAEVMGVQGSTEARPAAEGLNEQAGAAPGIPEEEREAHLRQLHGRVHHSASSMMREAARVGKWPGISRDVKEYVQACEVCQRAAPFKDKKQVGRPTASSVRNEEWELDLMFVETHNIFTAREVSTGFYLAETLEDKSAASVWDACQRRLIMVYGAPKRFRVDPGMEFIGEFAAGCGRAGIKLHPTPVGDNNPIGGVERAHGTLGRWLRTLDLQDRGEGSFEQHLAEAVAELNAMVKEGTSVSPFEAWTGRPWVRPGAGARGKQPDPQTEEHGTLEQRASQVAGQAQGGLQDIQRARKRRNDKEAERRGRPERRQVGDLVRYLPKARDKVKPERIWLGPFRVNRVGDGAKEYDLVPMDVRPGTAASLVAVATMVRVSGRFIETWPWTAVSADTKVEWPVLLAQRRDRWLARQDKEAQAERDRQAAAHDKQARAQAKAREQHAAEEIREQNVALLEEQKQLSADLAEAQRAVQRARTDDQREEAMRRESTVRRARDRVARFLRRAVDRGQGVRQRRQSSSSAVQRQ